MSDQNGGKTETSKADSKPEPAPDAKPDLNFSQNRASPIIEGEAEEAKPPQETTPSAVEEPKAASPESGDAASDLEAPEPAKASAAPKEPASTVDQSESKGGAFRPVAALLGAVALGGGAYYLWNAYVAEPPPAPTPVSQPAPARPAPPSIAPSTPQRVEPPASVKPQAQNAPAENPPAGSPPVERPKPAASNAETDKAFAEMTAKLAAAQSAVERLSQRLQTVESQLAAPKNDARASLSARDAGPGGAGEAAARVVVAQSLLTALRQGDDYATQLAALQNFGPDSGRLARLRAGLSAPSVNRLIADFKALAPQLAAAAAPPKPVEETKPPRNTGEAILAYLEAGARKLVRVRPAGSPDKDAAAVQIEKIEQDLRAGDLAAALADREKLPAAALPLSAGWAAATQARFDAETAAKAELADAMQNLTKPKS